MGLYCSTPAFSQSCSILSCAYLTFPAVLTSAALFTNSNLLHKEMSTVFAIKFPSLSISASTYNPTPPPQVETLLNYCGLISGLDRAHSFLNSLLVQCLMVACIIAKMGMS